MTEPKVFFIHLRRPDRSDPNERRDDPFYEFGSFGCTKCHSKNLFHPRHAAELDGARLAFVQGGSLGSRLVFLTPPITLKTRQDRWLEAKWTPTPMPFKYAHAPIVAYNEGTSDFPLVQKFARKTRCTTDESGLYSIAFGHCLHLRRGAAVRPAEYRPQPKSHLPVPHQRIGR